MQDSRAAAFVTRLVLMAADAFIQFRVTPEEKALVRALAAREQITESALVKQLLTTTLRSASLQGLQVTESVERPNRDSRLYVRLDPEDRMMLSDRAAARGMRSATYASVFLRAHLRNLTPIPRDELLALKRSIAELRMLGSNLNQIAKALHQGDTARQPGLEDVRTMLRIAEALRDHFKALLIANERSWRQGHG
jgi:uncharacterized protein (DUF1778 family)